jgi:hypothetical protein
MIITGGARANLLVRAVDEVLGTHRVTCRRKTATSWRSTMISASFDAWPRPSKSSQQKTRVMTAAVQGWCAP